MGATDTPLTSALRHAEWMYGRNGWHGDGPCDAALYSLHYRSPRRHALKPVPIPVSDWCVGVVGVLNAFRTLVDTIPLDARIPKVHPLWCGGIVATEIWAVHHDAIDAFTISPSKHPQRFSARVVVGVTEPDLDAAVAYREEGDEVLRVSSHVPQAAPYIHALTSFVAATAHRRDAERRAYAGSRHP